MAKKQSSKDLLSTVSPQRLMREVHRGWLRFQPDRWRARFTAKLSAGPAFISDSEVKCDSPLPLLFNAARTLVPQLVINFPRHVVETPYLPARQYAQSLGLALSLYDKKQSIPNIYRTVIVDALHSLGILKTGVESGGDILEMENEADGSTKIDNGQVYTERVSFDNFIADPDSREYLFLDARFLGNIIRVPRKVLLDSGQYDEDLVRRLPRDDSSTDNKNSTAALTMGNINANENSDLEDTVKIAEIWIPSANAVVTIPGVTDSDAMDTEEYLRVTDYYGVKEGPYTFLSLTIPIPDNPLPVPLMRILFQLEMAANRMATKISMQADRQKDVLLYRAEAADTAKMIVDAADGETIQCPDPTAINKISLGGQENSNEIHLDTLMSQFNMLAANVETLSGVSSAAKSATAANILQQNSAIGLADMQNAVYQMAAQEARRRAFYIHTDPLMNVILSKRVAVPGQMGSNMMGMPQWVTPPQVQNVQEYLTPEQKDGDFLDLVFTIEPESMARVDSKLRLQQEQNFCQQILPAVVGAAQICQQLGMPFDAPAMLSRMAKDAGITWLDEVLYSPQIQQKAAMEYNAIQQATGGTVKPGQEQQGNPLQNAMLQNGQQGNIQAPQPGPPQQQNMAAQGGAQDAQRIIRAALMSHAQPKPAAPNQNAF
jgi:hypothetical protein